jgi:hypothetical protein
MFALARAFVAERLRAAQKAGTLGRKVAVDEAAELLVRLSFSFALIEDSVLPLEDPDRAAGRGPPADRPDPRATRLVLARDRRTAGSGAICSGRVAS